MIADYSDLKSFIRETIVDPKLETNYLKITKSAIKSITDKFDALGWTVENTTDPEGRYSKHILKSPNEEITLAMLGGKVFRHPLFTEQICRRKHLTKKMLNLSGVTVPQGDDFSSSEKEVAKAYFTKIPKPAVIKPTDSGGSHGVTVGVDTESEFDTAWEYALSEGRGRSNVLIEQFVKGVELRPYVVGDKVVSVVARVQPFVVGDGVSDMAALVNQLSISREVNYRAKRLNVVVEWDFVREQGYGNESIPECDRIVFLNPFCYPTIGASIVDITDQVSDDIKELAVKAKNAIPELEIAGIDILVQNINSAHGAHVVEVNTAAALDMHRYPTHGTPRAIDEDIVGYFHQQFLSQV